MFELLLQSVVTVRWAWVFRMLLWGILVLAASTPAWAQSSPVPSAFGGSGDPFGGIVNVIDANLQRWCGALLALGFLGVGASFALGSHSSGTYARNVLFASLFLLMAGTAGGVLAVLAKARALTGNVF
jgi:hypothetical protein